MILAGIFHPLVIFSMKKMKRNFFIGQMMKTLMIQKGKKSQEVAAATPLRLFFAR
jgi:hypothetical protein